SAGVVGALVQAPSRARSRREVERRVAFMAGRTPGVTRMGTTTRRHDGVVVPDTLPGVSPRGKPCGAVATAFHERLDGWGRGREECSPARLFSGRLGGRVPSPPRHRRPQRLAGQLATITSPGCRRRPHRPTRVMNRTPTKLLRLLALTVWLGTAFADSAQAYIGPGAGFAILGSFMVLAVSMLLAFSTILLWPIRAMIRIFYKKRALQNAHVDRVV